MGDPHLLGLCEILFSDFLTIDDVTMCCIQHELDKHLLKIQDIALVGASSEAVKN